jgi:23S rRNA (uridine2552-2'-O)-methyltransferase
MSDQARSIYLAELALEFSVGRLNSGGNFLVKVFQGSGFEQFLLAMRATFKQVLTRKPEASRGRSSEIYLLGLGKREKNPPVLEV